MILRQIVMHLLIVFVIIHVFTKHEIACSMFNKSAASASLLSIQQILKHRCIEMRKYAFVELQHFCLVF